MTLYNLNYLSKVLFPSTIILEVWAATYKLWVGDAFSSQRKEGRKERKEEGEREYEGRKERGNSRKH